MSSDAQYKEVDQAVESTDNASVDYESRTGQKDVVPVDADTKVVEDPIDPATADSDETLASDEKAAMDESNILDERTRGAAKPDGSYAEPGDEEGLPGPDDGTSAVTQ